MKTAAIRISDHAVLRYLERVCGLDIKAVRAEIARRAGLAAEHPGASAVISGGFAFRLRGDVVITLTPRHRPRGGARDGGQGDA